MTEQVQLTEAQQLTLARTLLRIVAQLQKTEYSDFKTTDIVKQQAEVRQHNDLPDPASDCDTAQG